MTNKTHDRVRRATLGALVGGSALMWHKPIVQSLVLPAHAQTTQFEENESDEPSGADSSGSGSSGSGASSGGETSSSGAAVTDTSSSGASSSGAGSSSGGSGKPKLVISTPVIAPGSLVGGACVMNCDGAEALLMIDIYDGDTRLLASYETREIIQGDGCFQVPVTPGTFGLPSKSWPSKTMFVIGVNVPACGLSDQTSGTL